MSCACAAPERSSLAPRSGRLNPFFCVIFNIFLGLFQNAILRIFFGLAPFLTKYFCNKLYFRVLFFTLQNRNACKNRLTEAYFPTFGGLRRRLPKGTSAGNDRGSHRGLTVSTRAVLRLFFGCSSVGSRVGEEKSGGKPGARLRSFFDIGKYFFSY